MIEFKSECGHTVRARDEDAGGVVRCSYCGRTTAVPENKGGDLDFLLSELEGVESSKDAARPKSPRRGWFGRRRSARKAPFNPFAIIARLIYAAILISIVVILLNWFILPMIRQGKRPRDVVVEKAPDAKKNPQTRRGGRDTEDPQTEGHGLIGRSERRSGVNIFSVPYGARVYAIESSNAPTKGRIHKIRGVALGRANDSKCLELNDGIYVVEVVLPWNNPGLKLYRGYDAFRKAIESANESERRRLLASYFLPDEAADVFIDASEEQIDIVRQYRMIEVLNRQSRGIRSLFLPIEMTSNGRLNIEGLVRDYLPEKVNYAFNHDHARSELSFYDVPETDQPYVLAALERIGAIPFVTPDAKTRLFKIGIHDGNLSAPVIRDLGR